MRRKASSLLPLLLLLRSLSNTSNGGGFFLLFFFTGVIRITMEDGIAPIAPPFGVIASRTFSSLSGPFVVLFVVGLEEAKCLRSFSGLAPLTPLLSIGFEMHLQWGRILCNGTWKACSETEQASSSVESTTTWPYNPTIMAG
uniref:Uncharacterized protein LOC114912650 isoform X2 n=1 Tax=Elaeis guineensis var. tenera TaxID=51953 RepID=A0A8N4I9X7_ELAGV|nr:uncharacterized protein LOC114912650 isoform X2 [Elaeis guineensis]